MVFKKIYIAVALVTVQILFLLFTNTHQLITDYYLVRPELDKTENAYLNAGRHVIMSDLYQTYASYTGTSSGYGFFAPSVGSEFILLFSVYDDAGTLLGVDKYPQSLIQNESRNRFDMYTLPMMKRLKNGKNELLNDYFEVMLHEVSRKISNGYEAGNKVVCEAFIHKYPEIEDFKNGYKEQFISLEKYIFNF
jgi:hypothetical protein